MTIYVGDIQKSLYGVYITNRYHIEASGMLDAMDGLEDIAQLEAELFQEDVTIDALRVSTPAVGDKLFYTVPVTITGKRDGASPGMPMFTRFRVDMSVGFTRPLRKFLLWPLEQDQAGGTFLPAAINFVNTKYCNPLLALNRVVSESGATLTAAVCKPQVGMRQLRRGSKRTSPVI